VLTLVELLPDIHPGGTLPADHLPCELELQGVVFRYQMRPLQTVLAGVSFRVPAGSVCALVGKSGGGKSTLVHLVLRFYDPLEGKITFGGEDYRNINLLSLHRQIGVVSQETQLFNASVAENIAYGTEDASEEEIYAAARAAQAHDFVSAFEDGYHTRVGERGQRLSGGQKQRISIARCLLRKPRLLLLDEATSALDAESESQVQAALDGLIWTGNHTVILVAHRLSTVVNAHKIVVIDQGLVAETGTHSELLEANGTYASLVAKQVQKSKETIAQ
jgi:ATP-binding cassette subfamily B protein